MSRALSLFGVVAISKEVLRNSGSGWAIAVQRLLWALMGTLYSCILKSSDILALTTIVVLVFIQLRINKFYFSVNFRDLVQLKPTGYAEFCKDF